MSKRTRSDEYNNIPLEKWPLCLKRLNKIFTIINTNLTFILSHSRATLPTYEYFKKTVPELTITDLACIKYLLPSDDVFFDYVDKEQLMTSDGKPKFSYEKGYEMNQPDTIDQIYSEIASHHDEFEGKSQLLLFKFEDMKIDNIGSLKNPKRQQLEERTIFNIAGLDTQKLTQSQLTNIIRTRKEKFEAGVCKYIESIGENIDDSFVEQDLEKLAEKHIPKPPDFTDPVQNMSLRSNRSINRLNTLSSSQMIHVLKSSYMYKDQIEFQGTFTEAKDAEYKKLDVGMYGIHPSLVDAIKQYKGIDIESHLYLHQTKALEAILSPTPKHVIISTSTSSGKSLVYQIPILNEILWDIESNTKRDRKSCAMFIFPTKALAQDQKKHLTDLILHIGLPQDRSILVETYDGDTENKSKQHIRRFADIIFTNPDTIHASILPNHDGLSYANGSNGWESFLKALKYVVVDEIHVYKGTFGINVSLVMTRLMRILDKIGATQTLRFISCSATVLNPGSHFRVVCSIPKEQEIVEVSKDGSFSCNKELLIWLPPPLMNKRGEVFDANSTNTIMVPRISTVFELARILLLLLSGSKSIKVIVFCPIRVVCESLMKEARQLLQTAEFRDSGIDIRDIMAYRGGYSKSDRRTIERKMFNGEVRALVATNALELGVDLADLDVVITCGFPQLKLNMHQQFGRAGRGKGAKGSLAIFVAGSVPSDQYYLKHPEELLDKSTYEDLCVESLMGIHLHKLMIEKHLQCAAFEFPVDIMDDMKWFCNDLNDEIQVRFFKEACEQKLNLDKLGRYRTDPEYLPWPAAKVTIRAIETPAYAVVDITSGRNIVIEEVEESRTSFTLYEGGIFLHQGLPYLVKEFNTDGKFAKVQRVNVDWTTSQRDFTDVDPYEIEFVKCLITPIRGVSDFPAYFGTIETTIIVFGFFKVNKKNEIIEAVEVKNPPIKYKSKGLWLDIPKPALEAISSKFLSPAGGIHAAQHAIMNILPLFISGGATTDPNAKFTSNGGESELVTECKAPEKEFANRQTQRKRPARLIFHDAKGGKEGSGISAKMFEYIDDILMTAYERVKNCDCEWGCPQCVAATFCKEMMRVMSKPAAYIILGSLVGRDIEELCKEVPDGPEDNMPAINVETIEPTTTVVRMSKDIQILEVRKALHPLKHVKKEPEEMYH